MRIFISLFFILSSLSALAQVKQDVIYLKNGGVYRGKILPAIDSNTVRIEILGGSIFVVNRLDIASSDKQDAPDLRVKGPITPQKNGWFNEFSFGLPMGANQWGWFTSGVTLNYVLGYQYNRKLKFGLGTGIDYYDYNATIIPIFARITGDLNDKKVSPFYMADIGIGNNVSFGWDSEDHKGGFMMFLGGGLKINTRRSAFFNISCGYKTQYASSYHNNPWLEEPYTEYRQFNRIESKIAFGF